MFDHAGQTRRRDPALLGCTGEHTWSSLGPLRLPVNRDTVSDWMMRFGASMQEHREELVRLDTAIGDGDHGTNMDRGMRKALEKLSGSEPEDAGTVLKTVAMALVSSVGGAAGPLY